MSAICCVAPSSLLMTGHHGSLAMAAAPYYSLDSYSTALSSNAHNFYYQHQQQQQFVAQQQTDAIRRKRLEDALMETIPAASNSKVSRRIVQLQQSLYASLPLAAAVQTMPKLTPTPTTVRREQQQQISRTLSIDPGKDYSQPLNVDCSIEYDLPRVVRPPPGAQPLLLIAPRRVRAQPEKATSTGASWPSSLYVIESSSSRSNSLNDYCDQTSPLNSNNNWMPHLPLLPPPPQLGSAGESQQQQWSSTTTHRHQFKQQVIHHHQSKATHHQRPECVSRCCPATHAPRWTPYNCQQQQQPRPRQPMSMMTLDHLLPTFHI